MHWEESNPDCVKYYKKKKAVKIQTVNGIQIWRSAYGMSRLIKEFDDKIYTSNIDFFTIKEAIDAARKMK
jgi:hypothetical protein